MVSSTRFTLLPLTEPAKAESDKKAMAAAIADPWKATLQKSLLIFIERCASFQRRKLTRSGVMMWNPHNNSTSSQVPPRRPRMNCQLVLFAADKHSLFHNLRASVRV